MSDEKRCGTCVHWRTSFGEFGRCGWPCPAWVFLVPPTLHENSYSDGVCPTWEAKR